jgi:hypothetical protein
MTTRSTTFILAGTLGLTACTLPPAHPHPSAPPASGQSLPSSPAGSTTVGSFDQTLSLQGVSFHVVSANAGSINQLRIEPKGLKGDNAAIQREIDGTVTLAEVADLNADGSPEVYVYVTSAGSGSYGSLVAYAVNGGKSMSEIFLPPLQDDPKASKGYLGHDEFRVVENTLVRRFPVYADKDTNAQPTGGTRQVQYQLKAGEAGWILKPYRVVNF